MEHDKQNFLLFWTIFFVFYPVNQNFGKMKKTPGDIIILYMSAINENHVMYGS